MEGHEGGSQAKTDRLGSQERTKERSHFVVVVFFGAFVLNRAGNGRVGC